MDLRNSSSVGQYPGLSTSPDALLQSSQNFHVSFLALAKQYLDPLASTVSETQLRRQQELRKKRKRGDGYDEDVKVLQLKKVHVDGFGPEQVWEQAKRVLDATRQETELVAPITASTHEAATDESDAFSEHNGDVLEHNMSDSEDLGEEGVDWELDEDGMEQEEDGAPDEDDPNVKLSDEEELEEDEESDIFSDASDDDEAAETFVPDPHGLNDGFFSIDEFNKQSEFLEQQDARGEDPTSDDEEEVNWEADPLAIGASKRSLREPGDDLSEDDDENGPTFGNMDLNAPEGDSEDDEPLEDGEMDDMGGMGNANNIMYADFYAPPAKVGKNKKKRGRPNPHNFPSKTETAEDGDDIDRTMSAVHRDLFEDDDDAESDGDLSDVDPADPKSRRSTHERRQAKLAEQIRKLEAANVAKREWQLSGEARAADRPLNSLLEEDLEFERAGKPVPVITAEVTEDIEALIKRRILAAEFDEVIRRRPDDLATGPKVRRGQFELDDTKSGKGLAEIYEEEHLRNTDPNFVDVKDEKLKKEHAEIEGLWKSLCRKLDSLSSWHYKPKPAEPSLEVRVDVPAIEMEDARPTASDDVASASMLAPQEIYKPGEEKSREEIVTKSGMPIAREEMTREQKLRRRRREKERIRKAGQNKSEKPTAGEKKAEDKKKLIGDLKRAGVGVIGKKGEVTDVEGKKVGEKARFGVGNLKL
jgi:U3 small nucleolar RNA-associated protein MPP10